MAKQTRGKYRDYTEVIVGKLYAAIHLPDGNGGYTKKRKRVSSKFEARQWAEDQLNKYGVGTESIKTVKQLALWYKDLFVVPATYQNNVKVDGLRTWKDRQTAVDRLIKDFGHLKLTQVTEDLLIKHKRKRLQTVSVTSVNREFTLLKLLLTKAKTRGWTSEDPFEHNTSLIDKAAEVKRQSPLTKWMAGRLMVQAKRTASTNKKHNPLLYPLLVTLAYTGARPSEVFPFKGTKDGVTKEPLTWGRVTAYNFQMIELVAYKGKKRKVRFVPTSTKLEGVLRDLHTEVQPTDKDLIFDQANFQTSWRNLCRSLQLSGVIMRDFRHLFNSYLVSRSDINDMERMLLLGHESLATNARYSKLDQSFVDKFRRGLK